MTALVYYNKGEQREIVQLPEHRENVVGPTGTFLDKNATQRENKITGVVSLGNTRKIHMQAYHIGRKSRNKCSIATRRFASDSVCLARGLLFVLHRCDERPQVRTWTDENDLSFLQTWGSCIWQR